MADDLRRIRQSSAEAKKRLARVRERLSNTPETEEDDRPTLDEIVTEVTKRHQLTSTGELVIDAKKKTGTLRAPPWLIATLFALAAGSFVAWLVLR